MFIIETKDADGNPIPGLTITKMTKLGYKAIDTCELTFENVARTSGKSGGR